ASARDAWLRADPARVHQVFHNLVTNALRYSPESAPVEVTVWADDLAAYYAVTDHGTGMPPEDLSKVFERYVRVADDAPPRPDEGAPGWGIGLYVCRKIVVAHGGEIWAELGVGGGASFVFTIPTWEAEA